MSFKAMNTKDDSTAQYKTLLYAPAGWGKTTQAKYYKEHYGKGFILSGEAGLSSVRSAAIDFLPFTSFDGAHEPSKNVYSFTGICRMMTTTEFAEAGYKWVMVDSLTELSDMVMRWATDKADRRAAEDGKKVNGFDKWGDYADKMVGACKFIRNLPMQVVISCLSQEVENEDGSKDHLPLLHGNKIKSQIRGIFDNVMAGVTTSTKETKETPAKVTRLIVTGDYGGFHGKVRDEHNVIKLIEETASVVDVLKKIEQADLGDAKAAAKK